MVIAGYIRANCRSMDTVAAEIRIKKAGPKGTGFSAYIAFLFT
jgi:hypothetical protein